MAIIYLIAFFFIWHSAIDNLAARTVEESILGSFACSFAAKTYGHARSRFLLPSKPLRTLISEETSR